MIILEDKSHRPIFRKIRLPDFTPMTASKKKLDRKERLKQLIEKEFGKDLQKVRTRCKDKHLLIDATFYVIESDKKGRSKPDIDNLLKILFDVLSENMVNGQNAIPGLGIIKNDSQIYEIKCNKIPSDENNPREGLDFQISIIP